MVVHRPTWLTFTASHDTPDYPLNTVPVEEARLDGDTLVLKRRSKDPQFLMKHMVPRMGRAGEPTLEYLCTTPEKGDDGWDVANAHAVGLDTSKIGSLMRCVLAGDCRAGPQGCARWISLLEEQRADQYGTSYNAIALAGIVERL